MTAKAPSLQDQFLNSLRKSRAPVAVFLVKGVKLQGVITAFDAFSILLRREGSTQLLYKHAVSTITPSEAPALTENGGERRAATLQDLFLAAAERDRAEVTMFLVNGVMLQGQVAAHDQFCLVLSREQQAQLVYKHAISTLQPASPLDLQAESAAAGDEP